MKCWTPPACCCCPAASTRTRISTCRSAAPPRATISKPERARRPSAAPQRIVDFAIQARGTKMRDALDTWWKKAESKACIDYGLHMIVTDLPEAGLEDMDDMVREGVASFKLFMAYPNVLMVDDATIFRALAADVEKRRAHLHARRERQRDRRDGAPGAGRRQDRAHLSRAHASHAGRSGSRASRHRAGRDGGRAHLHRASVVGRCVKPGARSARPRLARVCRNLPAISAALHRRYETCRVSKARSMCSRRRCARSRIFRSCGTG